LDKVQKGKQIVSLTASTQPYSFEGKYCSVNPLTPELNPCAQRCLTGFFTGDFAS
jgi:hypothetical protein